MTAFDVFKKIHDICANSPDCIDCPFMIDQEECGIVKLAQNAIVCPRFWQLSHIKEILDD